MRQTWLGGALAVVVLGGLSAVAAAQAPDRSADRLAAAANVDTAQVAAGSHRETHGVGEKHRHPGPPPWSHANTAHANDEGGHVAWKRAWRHLTEPQRARTMARLAKAHAEGMRAWAKCVTAARGDATERAACDKP